MIWETNWIQKGNGECDRGGETIKERQHGEVKLLQISSDGAGLWLFRPEKKADKGGEEGIR